MAIRTFADDPLTLYGIEVGQGNVTGVTKVNKFGEALDADSGVATDVWDGADGVTSTDVWVAPTQARDHNVASTDANDTSAGTGMQTCRLYGLQTWASSESSEVITMNGMTDVLTANSYVIVHRVVGETFGSGGTNAGIVTATAVTDATVTAAIQAGEGQTLMCIYGVGSTESIYMTYLGTGISGVGTAISTGKLLVMENADQSTAGFVTKQKWRFTEIDSYRRNYIEVPKSFSGPCIVKVQVSTNTNNSVVSGEFDAYVVTN